MRPVHPIAAKAHRPPPLSISLAGGIFSGSEGALERRFFELFEDLCREVRDICEA
jgi:hypothetical protein